MHIDARCDDPSLPLIRVRPSGDSPHRVSQSAVDAFNDVRGPKLISQRLCDPQFVERERSLKTLL